MPTEADDRVKILVVDDLPDKLLVIQAVLEQLGEHVVVARSGAEALQQVLCHDFAVILLDVLMPDMNGYETAALIRKRKRSAHTPIIFITGYHDELHKAEGYKLGAVDYVLSPVVPDILRTKVKVFVDLFKMTEAVRRAAEERVTLAREQAAREAAERHAAALREREERLRLAFEAATMGWWEYDIAADLVSWSAILEQVMGFSPKVFGGTLAGLLRHVHPDDRQRLQEVLNQAIAQRSRYTCELRIVRPDGSLRWALTAGQVVCDTAGQPERLAGIDLDITDRKLAEEALQEAGRRKDEFLSMLAHELRNPLAPMRNAVEVLRLADVTDPIVTRARDMIDRQVTHMTRLVDDLLDATRIARGKVLLRKDRCDLARLVRQTAEDYRSVIEATGLALHVAVPDSPHWVDGDPTRLAQLLCNLLHNAHKFTAPGGRIEVTVAAEAADDPATPWTVLRVRDSGVGIEADLLPHVFEVFMQADRSLDRSRGGLGLGLALVKGLVELHGGQVEAASDGPGLGACFTVRLPRAAARPPAGPGDSDAAGGRAVRVLLIEDNPDMAESTRELLALEGHEVATASGGSAGLTLARTFEPDVILCDIGLPGMNGYEVARAVRRDPVLATTCVIALTGYSREEDLQRAREAGFDLHLAKPVDLTLLRRALTVPTGGARPRSAP